MSSSKRKRRSWSAKEKLRIVLTGLESGVEVSELCRREGIGPTQFYNWKSQLLGSAESVFGDRRSKRSGQAAKPPLRLRIRRNAHREIRPMRMRTQIENLQRRASRILDNKFVTHDDNS